MNKGIGVIGSIIGVILIVMLLGAQFFESVDSARGKEYVQTVPNVTTTDGTTATVTLLKDPVDNDVTNVITITSNSTDDTPAVDAYVTASNSLSVIGLAEATTRTLTVTYNYARLDSGSDRFMTILGFLIIVAIVIFIGIEVWQTKRR